MSMELFYFSGTGNSLHVARGLLKRFPEAKATPIVASLGKPCVESASSELGIVFPIHYLGVPSPVWDFIRSLKPASNQYLFAIATRYGSQHIAFEQIDEVLGKGGHHLDAAFSVTMANNDPKYDAYRCPTDAILRRIDLDVELSIDRAARFIASRRPHREIDAEFSQRIPALVMALVPFMNRAVKPIGELFGFKCSFYADEACVGCGQCAWICPAGKIVMENEKPVWPRSRTCFYCYACLNFCPRRALQIRGWTERNGRYSHPYATVDEIAAQKDATVPLDRRVDALVSPRL